MIRSKLEYIKRGQLLTYIMAMVLSIALLTNMVVYAATDTYLAVNGANVSEVGVSGNISTYTPSFGNNDHRDYMLYIVNGNGHTIGAGVQWWKHPYYGLMNRLIVYIYQYRVGHSHIFAEDNSGIPNGASITISVIQRAPNSTCWDAKAKYGTKELIYTKCIDGFTTGIPGAVSRTLSSQYNSSNTLKERFANLNYYYWEGSTLKWKDFNTTITEMKCFSDVDEDYQSTIGTNWVITYINSYKEFGTGPPIYTTDNCTIDIDAGWDPTGE